MNRRPDAEGSIGADGTVRFGPFEFDARSHELRSMGHAIRLQEQPFHILRMLLESPGELVSREDVRKQLWPNDITVEFDQSINTAIKRLRDELRDTADKPATSKPSRGRVTNSSALWKFRTARRRRGSRWRPG